MINWPLSINSIPCSYSLTEPYSIHILTKGLCAQSRTVCRGGAGCRHHFPNIVFNLRLQRPILSPFLVILPIIISPSSIYVHLEHYYMAKQVSRFLYHINRCTHQQLSQLSPPFSATTSPLGPDRPAPAPLSRASLPAAYCDQDNELVRRGSGTVSFITLDMDVSRLNHIHPYLWLVGRPTHARPLHRQKMLERQIIVTEQADLHMV